MSIIIHRVSSLPLQAFYLGHCIAGPANHISVGVSALHLWRAWAVPFCIAGPANHISVGVSALHLWRAWVVPCCIAGPANHISVGGWCSPSLEGWAVFPLLMMLLDLFIFENDRPSVLATLQKNIIREG